MFGDLYVLDCMQFSFDCSWTEVSIQSVTDGWTDILIAYAAL